MKKINEFKVGDRVIGNDLASDKYYYTRKGWQGVVESINSDGYFKSRGYTLDPQYFNLLEAAPELKVELGVNYEIY